MAIAGSSGAGKSTLLNMIPRFYEVDQGEIRIDEIELRECRLASLRRQIAYVGPEHYLVDTSIRENLLYAAPHASEDQLLLAARQANAHAFIESLPQGYETRVGQNGVKLSGGQRQRLSLARAFLMPTKILLLDEPTASIARLTTVGVMNSYDANALFEYLLVNRFLMRCIRNLSDKILRLHRSVCIVANEAIFT